MSEISFSGNTLGDKALYLKGIGRGEKNERERIVKLWYKEMSCLCERPLQHLLEHIEGENK